MGCQNAAKLVQREPGREPVVLDDHRPESEDLRHHLRGLACSGERTRHDDIGGHPDLPHRSGLLDHALPAGLGQRTEGVVTHPCAPLSGLTMPEEVQLHLASPSRSQLCSAAQSIDRDGAERDAMNQAWLSSGAAPEAGWTRSYDPSGSISRALTVSARYTESTTSRSSRTMALDPTGTRSSTRRSRFRGMRSALPR